MALQDIGRARRQMEFQARALGLPAIQGEEDLELALRVALAANGLDEDDPLHSEEPLGPVWKMKDGSEIAVQEMSDKHLHNTIRMLQRGPDSGGANWWLRKFREEVERRRKLAPPEILCSQCGEPLRQLKDAFACDPCGRTVDGINWDF